MAEATAQAAPAILPPYLVIRDFLGEQTVAALLAYAAEHEHAFAPTSVGVKGAIDPGYRSSLALHELGPFRPMLQAKMLTLLPDLVAALRCTPVQSPRIELELVAHNDGAFYKRHLDTQTATDHESLRLVSAVYYFHGVPQAFSGGALRLHAFGDSAQSTHVDIAPQRDSLLVFPSWAPHEVMRVSCPSKRFIDSRFAINCWFHRPRAQQPLPGST